MEKSKYYYCRDSNNRPVVTVCLLKTNGNIAQGVAICSLLDNPCKKTGSNIASAFSFKLSPCSRGRDIRL